MVNRNSKNLWCGSDIGTILTLDRYLSLPPAESLRAFMNFYPAAKLEDHPGFTALVEKHGWVQKERGAE